MSVLLLQGPLGSFFKRLRRVLEISGVETHRIVFNGGDGFYSDDPTRFTGTLDEWPAFLSNFIAINKIKTVLVYGDCRHYHLEANSICKQMHIRYFAFEEGYLRPNYITVEEGGVNVNSPITQSAISQYEPVRSPENEVVIPSNFFKRSLFAIIYYNISFINRRIYKFYVHHRSFNPAYDAMCWVRGFIRKVMYRMVEPSSKKIIKSGGFFLVPLQVHYDMQVKHHCNYDSVDEFIVDVMTSFSRANPSENLVIKHHPMDRGYKNYHQLIFSTAKKLGIEKRVRYIHDQHLPTLLKACKGVVVINSTTAIQAFYHRAPVKVMGGAFFDMPGLTCQNTLFDFWKNPGLSHPVFNDQFKAYMLDHGQINGSFYCEHEMTINNTLSYFKKLHVF